MVLALGDVGHLLHGTTVGEDVPLAAEALVAEEVEEAVGGDGKPDGGGGAEDDPRRLTWVVHALPRHHPHVLVDVPRRVQLVPLVHRRRTHPRAEVVCHPLRQLQHAPPPARRYPRCNISYYINLLLTPSLSKPYF